MLRALDYLQSKGIIHRDLKPENILYSKYNDETIFQLADFGLSNLESIADTISGSDMYMAPEIYYRDRIDMMPIRKQTDKADVWSLFVTILWVLDYKAFRSTEWKLYPSVCRFVKGVVSNNDSTISSIKDMAAYDPVYRASAAQMLVKLYGGDGLTTSPSKVPPLLEQVEQENATAGFIRQPTIVQQNHEPLPSLPRAQVEQTLQEPTPMPAIDEPESRPVTRPPHLRQNLTLEVQRGADLDHEALADKSSGPFGVNMRRNRRIGDNRIKKPVPKQHLQTQKAIERIAQFHDCTINEAVGRAKENRLQKLNRPVVRQDTATAAEVMSNEDCASDNTQPVVRTGKEEVRQPGIHAVEVSALAGPEATPTPRMPGTFPEPMSTSWTA
jgi:hypothetical protein